MLAALLGGALGAGLTAVRPERYAGAVDVVPVRGQVVAGPVTQGAPSWIVGATAERRQAMAQLVRNPDVERAVQRELGSGLPPGLREPGQLLPLVRARTALRSEVVTILVEAADATIAVDVAAAWGRAYEREVNGIYGANEVAVVNEVVLAEAVGKGVMGWGLRGAVVGGLLGAIAALVWPVRRT